MKERKGMIAREESMPKKGVEIPAIAPFVDIFESDVEILLLADMPGVDKKDVNVDNGKLTLGGLRKVETTGAAQWEEFESIDYQRTFSVPPSIDMGKINAELKNGVLYLHLPKSEAAKPQTIEIKSV